VSTPPHEPPEAGEQAQHAEAEEHAQHAENHCPRCGAPHDPLQEYCLECGLRLVRLPRERYTRTIVWSRESPIWLWTALAALLLVALTAGAIVALAATDDDKDAGPGASSATGPTVPPITIDTLPDTTLPIPPPTTTVATTTGLTTTTQSTTTTGSTTTGSTTTPNTIISWPAGTDGWTVILRSTPTSDGRGPADSAAQQAINAGLRQVGVLNSSDYDSLNPGYYVTFTGVYDTRDQALAALPNARSKGFPTAYDRRVAD
jgi:hypothetical protein